ncbi:uncharacterized protein EI90DRAFT_3123485 [Cantharellus anzutake]|uniref:uncharacterized protein n=1 Tax=Cantharellus anzutake TaxID=1750568 RepID=UPI001904D59A|nr:uncharacterized protein EI90DRAFT_3123485 [Cantharellus anzutake]KAF8331334.1 hypothetical protein EI90DRAFT_3123485 [Cantharellus anzutake]
MLEKFIEDESVSYQASSGAVDFEVEGVIFRLPKCILQRYKDSAFSNMIKDSNNESNRPIHLADTRKAFTEFRRVVYTHHHQSSKDLEKVLMVQKLAHKYCLSLVEDLAASISTNLATDAVSLRSRTTASLTPLDILICALDVKCEKLAVIARNVVKEDLWASRLCPYAVISRLNNYDEKEVRATAYYQVLLKGSDHWLHEQQLDRSHHYSLYAGITNLSAQWELIFSDWGSLFHIGIQKNIPGYSYSSHIQYTEYGEIHSQIWRNLAEKKFQPFDVLGKLKAIRSWTGLPRFQDIVRPAVNTEIKRIKSTLHVFFQDPYTKTLPSI